MWSRKNPAAGVHVVVAIRMAVVMSVMSDPPERPILAGKDTEKGEHELEQLAGLERMMGEQSVIAPR